MAKRNFFIAAPLVARKPAGISHVDAAALALTGLTALRSVEGSLKLKSGETILIQGGAGGVASFAIQLAKHLGARVITTASAVNLSYLRDIGADQVIDYSAADFTKVLSAAARTASRPGPACFRQRRAPSPP